MPSGPETRPARADLKAAGTDWELALGGDWRLTQPVPGWNPPSGTPARVRVRTQDLGSWDSALPLFAASVLVWCRGRSLACDLSALPEDIRSTTEALAAAEAGAKPRERGEGFLTAVGLATRGACVNAWDILVFIGESLIEAAKSLRRPGRFRWRDALDQMQQCGAMGLPIVSLIAFLVGLTLAYQAAVELRQFGADIYVADLVGLSVVREMGPIMAAVIVAGRTGAAFAATLGNMQANEEIDALRALGIAPVQFLVLPRLLALAIMMPLLALYADCVGTLGGMVVAKGVLQISASAYWIEMQTIVTMHDINSGLVKALVFGLLIGLAGCSSGLAAERSSEGVGRATTAAVVRAVLLIIVADALFAVIYNVLGI